MVNNTGSKPTRAAISPRSSLVSDSMAMIPDLLAPLFWAQNAAAPRCGYWLVRVRVGARGLYGPLVPAAIMIMHTSAEPDEPDNRMERSPFYAAFLAGEPVSIWTLQQVTHTEPEMFVRIEREIDENEYQFRLADISWAKEWKKDEPIAQPRKAVDWLQVSLPF